MQTSSVALWTKPRRTVGLGRRRSKLVTDIIVWIVLTAGGVMFATPFVWMVFSSLKTLADIYTYPPKIIPSSFEWTNYIEIFRRLPFALFFRNSFFIAISGTAGVLLTSSMAGYAFARLRFPGRDTMFLAYIATMMVPGAVTLIPSFAMMNWFRWVDTHWALIIPGLCTPYGTFMMRQFMSTLPRELEEAARIDGCGFFRIYRQIIVPLSTPVIATLGMMSFMGRWNAFMWPLIIISSLRKKTLPLGLAAFQSMIALKTPWHLIMAGAVVSILPIMILFLLGQKYYVQGIVTTGIKGAA